LNEIKGLLAGTIGLDIIGAYFLSLGILAPEKVRQTGEKIAQLVAKRPNKYFLQAAHAKIFGPPENWDNLDECIIELTVEFITVSLAVWALWITLVGLTLWGAFSWLNQISITSTQIVALCIGVIFCVSWTCVLFEGKLPNKETTSKKVLVTIVLLFRKPSYLLFPLCYIYKYILSIFTKSLPRAWYRSLKEVHRRGALGVYGLIGIALLVLSGAIKVYLMFTWP
jgi:hypothetical protein